MAQGSSTPGHLPCMSQNGTSFVHKSAQEKLMTETSVPVTSAWDILLQVFKKEVNLPTDSVNEINKFGSQLSGLKSIK